MFEVRLYSYGPTTSIDGDNIMIGPDEFIAAEGLGTYGGLDVKSKISELIKSGKDIRKITSRMHRESTRRGHASITTSLHLQLEVIHCSRVLSLILVAPPFGSYLQESQRRIRVDERHIIEPEGLGEELIHYRRVFKKLLKTYEALLENGIPLEDARYILPIGTSTSLFISSSFENYVGLLQLCSSSNDEFLPWEARHFMEKYGEIVSSIAPTLYAARMSFSNRLTTYPCPIIFKPHDPLMSAIVEGAGRPAEAVIIKAVNCLGDTSHLHNLLREQCKEWIDTVNPLVTVTALEPMSLAALHQAIRHRTVPTAVESIYTAAERAYTNPSENIVTPPSIKKDSKLSEIFGEAVADSLNIYHDLCGMGVKPSTACYILPQSLRIYAVRLYNGYNLIYPQGFIGTRTCSYTQWEERGIAYRIWRELEKIMPEIAGLMGEKCRYLGYCPERDWCPIITKYHTYNDRLHSLHSGK
jgi:thymidylate synthase ThyX